MVELKALPIGIMLNLNIFPILYFKNSGEKLNVKNIESNIRENLSLCYTKSEIHNQKNMDRWNTFKSSFFNLFFKKRDPSILYFLYDCKWRYLIEL